MPTSRRSPYPLLELDLDEIAATMRRSPPDPRPPSDVRKTMAPGFDVDAYAKAMSASPESEVRPASDLAKTARPPADAEEKSDVRVLACDPRSEELAELMAEKDYRFALVVAEEIL